MTLSSAMPSAGAFSITDRSPPLTNSAEDAEPPGMTRKLTQSRCGSNGTETTARYRPSPSDATGAPPLKPFVPTLQSVVSAWTLAFTSAPTRGAPAASATLPYTTADVRSDDVSAAVEVELQPASDALNTTITATKRQGHSAAPAGLCERLDILAIPPIRDDVPRAIRRQLRLATVNRDRLVQPVKIHTPHRADARLRPIWRRRRIRRN